MTIHPPPLHADFDRYADAVVRAAIADECRRRATTMTTTPTWPSVKRSTGFCQCRGSRPRRGGEAHVEQCGRSSRARRWPRLFGTPDFRRLTHLTRRHETQRPPSNFYIAHALFEWRDRFCAGGEWGC